MAVYLRAHPEDPSFEAFDSRRRGLRDMYLEHGRGTLGFALYQPRLEA
jgi:hypothetical protein